MTVTVTQNSPFFTRATLYRARSVFAVERCSSVCYTPVLGLND